MDIKNLKESLFIAIGENFDQALKILDLNLSEDSPKFPIFLLNKNKWISIKKDIIMGTLGKYTPEAQQHIAKINYAILEITKDLTVEELKVNNQKQSDASKARKIPAQHISKAVDEYFKNTQNVVIENSRIKLGFDELDKILPINRKELILLGGTKGIGTTSFALNLSLNISSFDKKVLYLSLDNSTEKIGEKLVEIHVIPLNHKDSPADDTPEIEENLLSLIKFPIFIDDNNYSFENILSTIRQNKKDNLIDVVFIDSLEFIKNLPLTSDKIVEFVKEIKLLSKELNILIFILFKIEKIYIKREDIYFRGLRKLKWWDEKLDLHVDNFLLLNRPEHYALYEDKDGESIKNMAEIIVNSITSVKLHCNKPSFKFLNYGD